MPSRDHWDHDEFRRHAHEAVDWLVDTLASAENRPIQPDVEPGWVRAQLPSAPPAEPEPFADLLRDLDDIVVPALTQWQHPGWFAYFPANTSPPSVIAELISAGLGQQGMLWATSPATTELESHVLDWMVELCGLPAQWRVDTGPGGGVIQMSASDSTHTALVVARQRATHQGAPIDDCVAYVSNQAHSSVEKGARVAGYRHIRLIDVDDDYAMRPASLAAQIQSDREAGLRPAVVTSAIGTTGTTAVDPIRAISEIARDNELWHHVDAAYAGAAMLLPEKRHLQDGVELVDSYTMNPHKWLFTNFDCNIFWVADRAPLIETLSILPPYLRNRASEREEVVDYRDWHVPLGRRFRALKLWFVLRSYGAAGLRDHLRDHIGWAQELAQRVDDDPRLERVAPAPFGLVCFRHRGGDAATDALADAVNASGSVYVTPSSLPDGRRFIRVSIGQTRTTKDHVDALWTLVDRHSRDTL